MLHEMNLRDKLHEILPSLLPKSEAESIKGKELIARVRAVLGDDYSDQSLRSQFSFLVLDDLSCLARVENGQGYYLRSEEEATSSLHRMFEAASSPEANDPYRKALALAVRLYDTAGLGAFVYPVEEDESWAHPDVVAVHWPAGRWEDGAYIFEGDDLQASYCSVCVAVADSDESCRRAFFRALACGGWSQQAELLLLGIDELPEEELAQLAARYGVGVRCIELDQEILDSLAAADTIFRASATEARALIEQLPQRSIAAARHKAMQLPQSGTRPDIDALLGWAESCLAKGRVESYELRVAVN